MHHGSPVARNVSAPRRKLLAKAVERASVQLDDLGLEELPERLTPHSLQRTFATVHVALGEPPTFVMGQLGHEKAELQDLSGVGAAGFEPATSRV